MGLCGSSANLTPEEIEARTRSQKLDQEATNHQQVDQQIKKLLLLGAGESGKSTLFKQAITLYGKGYTDEERRQYNPVIINNILNSIQTLLKYSQELKPPCAISSGNHANFALVNEVKQDSPTITAQAAQAIDALWKDPGIQACYERRSEFQLNDSTQYFLSDVVKFAAPGYMPSPQDVLRSRVRTTGIVETSFLIDGNTFKMFDVGGQRNERKKWIHCFEAVTAVLFVAAISEYDQRLYEDETQNRMTEALTLFEEIVNSRWFRSTSVILFLNKRDLFAEKLPKLPITVCPDFEKYSGPQEYEACCKYIKQCFVEKMKKDASGATKAIYSHITTATDTQNIRVVFDAVKQIIINRSLEDGGLL